MCARYARAASHNAVNPHALPNSDAIQWTALSDVLHGALHDACNLQGSVLHAELVERRSGISLD